MEAPQTLAESSVVCESVKAQALEDEGVKDGSRVSGLDETQTGLDLRSGVSVDGVQGNGVRVSVSKNGAVERNVVVEDDRVVEKEAGVEKSFGNRIESVGGDVVIGVTSMLDKDGKGGGSVLENDGNQMTGGSMGFQENGKESGFAQKIVEGNVSVPDVVCAVNENNNNGVDKAQLKEDGSSRLDGGESATKIEVSGEGISLVVEVHGSSASVVQDNGSEATGHLGISTSGCEVQGRSNGDKKTAVEEHDVSFPENGKSPGATVSELLVPMPETVNNENVEGREVVGEDEEVDEEEMEEGTVDPEHEFSVGDFVWGKIKSHPWWPGQIYDPLAASKYATKYHRRDRLLVAYFGDDTFAWCYPSQLKAFQEDFELMSQQSNSKRFLNAVEEAVEEIGRRLELEMTCACVPGVIRTGLARPLVVNAGINEGVAVPEGGVGELSITHYEPAKFLARLRYIAQVVSVTSILELKVFCNRLSAFYHSKGYRQVPLSDYAPEDQDSVDAIDAANVDGPTGDLFRSLGEVDELSSPVGPGVGKTCQISSQKWPGISDDKLYQKKKQRSMAELMGGDMDVESENHESNAAEEGVVSSKPTSTSKKRKRNKDSEDDINVAEEDASGNSLASQSKKLKKSNFSGSPLTAEKKSSSFDNDDEGVKGAIMGSSSRVRKKSKYLSPPYTNIGRRNKSLISSKDSETETPKVTKVSHVVECGASGQRTGIPPVVKCSGKTSWKKTSRELGILSPRTSKIDQNKIVLMEGNASAGQMLLELHTAALDSWYLKGNRSSDMIKGFFSRFRSSLYHDGSNFNMYGNKLAVQGSKKRKSLEIKPASMGKDSQVSDHSSSELKSKGKKRKREAMLQSPKGKLEHADGTSDLKTSDNKEKTNGEASDHPSSELKSKGKKRKKEALLQSPKGKLEHTDGTSDLKTSDNKDETNGVASDHPSSELKSKGKKRKKEAVLQSPKGKLEHADGTPDLKTSDNKDETKGEGSIHPSSELKSKGKKRKNENLLRIPKGKLKHADGTSGLKISDNKKETNGKTSAATLLLTFAPGFPLPSKDDLITIFVKFGALNELETEVLKESSCARVAFLRSSDAEAALISSEKINPFGHAVVSYRLLSPSASSRTLELCGSSHKQLVSPPAEGNTTSPNPSASRLPVSEAPPLQFIRQNLVMMTSMLEKAGDKLSPEVKAKLEGEIKGLLKKVGTMDEISP